MDPPVRFYWFLRSVPALRGVSSGPPANRAETETAAPRRARPELGIAQPGQRGSAAHHSRPRSFSGPSGDGVPPRLQPGENAFSRGGEGQAAAGPARLEWTKNR